MTAILIFFAAHWLLSLFFHSFFLHRYGTHRMFSLSPGWEKTFYVLTFISQGSAFLNPRAYALMHRMHHAYADTERDPHSPHNYKNVFGMMWKTFRTYQDIISDKIVVADEFQGNIPRWDALDKIAHSPLTTIFFGGFYVTWYIIFATNPWLYLLLPFHFMMGPIQGAIVNWCGHKYGYVRYKNLGDKSKNSLPVDLLTLGELYQNNHHYSPQKPNLAHRWYELDITYLISWILSRVGIIHLQKQIY